VTTLAAAVDAVDKLWTIDTMPDAPFLEAGDELVEISARFPEHIYAPTQETIPAKIRVRRAMAGTSAAIHAQGITLTPVYPESASSAGSEQTIRLLGPFIRTAAQVNAGTDVAPGKKLNLVAIEANVLVVRAWAFFTGGWVGTNPDPAKVTIGVDLESDEFDMVDAIRYESVGEVLATNGHTEDEGLLGTTNTGANQVVRRTAGGNLYIYAEGATSGTAEVYALIAEPSA
jgi:hypothetical protein